MSLSELFNKIMGFPTEEDRQKLLLEKMRSNVDDISLNLNPKINKELDDLQHKVDLLEMYANSTVIRTVGKFKDEDIFTIRIIRQVGQNYTRIGLSILIDCEQKCIVDEKGEIILQW